MDRCLIISVLFTIFFAIVWSHPAISSGGSIDQMVVQSEKKAIVAVNAEGTPEFVVVSDGDEIGRSAFGNILNFTSYLEGRDPNATQLSFIPLITILASGFSG